MIKNLRIRIVLILAIIAIFCGTIFALTNTQKIDAAEVTYTVDFTYGGKTHKVNGDTKEYNMSNVFSALNINDEISDIKVFDVNNNQFDNNVIKNTKNDTLFNIVKDGSNWILNIYNSFLDEYTLKAYSQNNVYNILVTDPVETRSTIAIDTSLQRFIYNGSAITPVLKNTSSNIITLDGFSITYEMYYKTEYGSCSDTKEPGLYKAHITRAEDSNYYAVDTNIEFVVTYSLTYKANTGVGEDIIDISDNDTIHKDYFGSHCDDEIDIYEFDAKATIKANTFTKANYTFAFWNTRQDGTGTSYKADDIVMLTDNTILYACYSADISKQPTKDNDYTVSVATTDSVSYFWEKETKIITPVDFSTITVASGTKNDNGTITAVLESSVYTIRIRASASKKLMFYTEGTLKDGIAGADNTYIYNSVGTIKKWYVITSDNLFTISNINYCSFEYTILSGETTSSIKNATENTTYRCTIKSAFNAVSYSDVIAPKAIKFAVGTNVTGTAPASQYQLEGRKITLPTTGFEMADLELVYWTDGDDKFNAGKEYTVPNSNVELTAVFGHICSGIIFDNELDQSFTGGKLINGNYFLSSDITLSSDINTYSNSELLICLNGHILNLNGYQLNTTTLELYDCNDDENTHNYIVDENGVWKLTTEQATKTIEQLTSMPSKNDIVSVKGGAIVGGSSQSMGGAIYASSLKAENISFIGNYSSDDYGLKGGAIFSNDVHIINCEFYGNRSIEGSAIYGENIAIYNSTFKFNTTYQVDVITEGICGGTGTIFCDGKLLINNSVIKYNSGVKGGAIFLEGDEVIATIISSTITNNTATEEGAGICFGDAACFIEGTLITMADGSTKAIEEIELGDEVKSFNHETGIYESQKVNYVYSSVDSSYYFTLNFESGESLGIVDCHDLFNKELNRYTTITKDNYSSFINKYFYNTTLNNGNGGWDKLVSVTPSEEDKNYYSIYVAYTVNCIANGFISCPDDVDYRLNIYEFDNNLVADSTQLQNDINTFGIKEFSDCKLVSTQAEYDALGIKYYNLYIGKGLITQRELNNLFYELHNYDEYTQGVDGLTLIIGKDTTIQNNKVGENESNVYLKNGSKIAVINGATNINVGVTLESTLGVFAENVYANNIGFTSDNNVYAISKKLNSDKYNYSICLIKEEPSKNNDYTTKLDDTIKDDYSYQWYEDLGTCTLSELDTEEYAFKYSENIDGNKVTSKFVENYGETDSYVVEFYFYNSVSCFVFFDSDEDVIAMNTSYSFIIYHNDSHYIVYCSDGDFVVFSDDYSFTLENITIQKVKKLTNETKSKFGTTTLNNSSYFCNIFDGDTLAETSEKITPNKVSFNGGTDATGTAPASQYQLEGRKITLPENTFTKTGYKFIGWNTDKDATTALNLTDNQYTIGSSNITFYAIWEKVEYVIVYNANGGNGQVANDSNKYSFGGEIILATADNLFKNNYVFAGWNTNKNATTGNTGKYTIVANDIPASGTQITLYAIWMKVITVEPSVSNDYTVTVDSSLSEKVSYQWYKLGSVTLEEQYEYAQTKPYENVSTIEGHKIYIPRQEYLYVAYSYKISLKDLSVGTQFSFYYDGSEGLGFQYISYVKNGNIYSCTITEQTNYTEVFYLSTTPLTNPYTFKDFVINGGDKIIAGETSKKLSNTFTIQDANYYCNVYIDGTKVATTEIITPKTITFDGGNGQTFNMYQLEGRKITLPSTGVIKFGYKMVGWEIDSTYYDIGDEYTVTGDATLSTVWELADSIDIYNFDDLWNARLLYNQAPDGYTVTWEIKADFTIEKRIVIEKKGIKLTINGNDHTLTAEQDGTAYDHVFDVVAYRSMATSFTMNNLNIIVKDGFIHGIAVQKNSNAGTRMEATLNNVNITLNHSTQPINSKNVEKTSAAIINNDSIVNLKGNCTFTLDVYGRCAVDLDNTNREAQLNIDSNAVIIVKDNRTLAQKAIYPVVNKDNKTPANGFIVTNIDKVHANTSTGNILVSYTNETNIGYNFKATVQYVTNYSTTVNDLVTTTQAKVTNPNIVREGYYLTGWFTESTFQTKWNFNTDLIQGDMKLYASWTKVIKTEPTKTNDYKVVVDESLTDVTYQWYKYKEIKMSELTPTTDDFVTGDYDSTSLEGYYELNISISMKYYVSNGIFKYKGTGSFYDTLGDDGYYSHPYNANICGNYFYILIETSDDLLINITDFIIVDNVALTGETKDKLGNTILENAGYYCEIIKDSKVIATSEKITPNKVSFNGGTDATGTAPASQYQLEGRKITLPENTFTKTGYKFIGWNTDKDATTALNLTDNQYTIGSSNITLYAIWEKVYVVTIVYDNGEDNLDVENQTKIVLPETEPTKENHSFDGWYLDSTFNSAAINDTILSKDTTIYAKWIKVIVKEPTKENDYTVVVNDSIKNDVTYQWYKGNCFDLDAWKSKNTNYAEYDSMIQVGGNKVYTSTESSLSIPMFNVYYKQIRINNLSQGDIITFTIDTSDISILTESNSSGFTYTISSNVCTLVANSDGYILLCKLSNTSYTDAQFSLNNIVIKQITKLEGQTNAKLGNTSLSNALYYCEVSKDNIVVATSEKVTPNKVSFVGGEGATGENPGSIYQLEGRKITLPINPYTKSGYTYTGWNDGTKTYNSSENYTVGSSDIELTASWDKNKQTIGDKKETEEKSNVEITLVDDEDGIPTDIVVTVEVTVEVEVESKELTVDYYNLTEENAKLEENEKVGVVFDVKLIQTIGGVSREIQPSDIKEGTVIKVKMLIPSSVDISKVTRILHVHSFDDIEEISFDASKIDENGYYEIEVDRLSEFAFIYKKDCITHWFLLGLLIALLGFTAIAWFILKIKNFKQNDKIQIIPIIGFSIHFIALVVLACFTRCAICVVFEGLNILVLVGVIILYLLYKENNEGTKIEIKKEIVKDVKEEVENNENNETQEEGMSLSEAINIAESGIVKLEINKKTIADYLENTFGKEVIVNRRNNYISSNILPLADTHYKVIGNNKKCFIYVYELRNGQTFMLVKTSEEIAKTIMEKHTGFTKSRFPKTKNHDWYTMIIDSSYSSSKDVLETLKLIFENM